MQHCGGQPEKGGGKERESEEGEMGLRRGTGAGGVNEKIKRRERKNWRITFLSFPSHSHLYIPLFQPTVLHLFHLSSALSPPFTPSLFMWEPVTISLLFCHRHTECRLTEFSKLKPLLIIRIIVYNQKSNKQINCTSPHVCRHAETKEYKCAAFWLRVAVTVEILAVLFPEGLKLSCV